MTLHNLARALLALLLLGQVAASVELLLLEHYEAWQIVPLLLLGVSLPLTLVASTHRRRWPVQALKLVMSLFLLGGCLGLVLHYRGNVEFELERTPAAHGLGLFWASIRGATPALAPSALIHLGFLGLVYTHLVPPRNPSPSKGPGDPS